MLNLYEAMVILRPELDEEKKKSVIKEVENILRENKAEIKGSEDFGRRHLTYEINKCREGCYYLINFSVDSSTAISKLRHACNINDDVLRALIVKTKLKEAKNG